MTDFMHDIRYAVRGLVQAPGFALVAILTLALGIGANSAIFSVVNGVVLTPLPYAEPDRLVFLTSAFPSMGFEQFWMSAPEYLEYREWNRSMEEVGAYNVGEVSVTGGDRPIRVQGAIATPSLFEVLGVPATRGRVFLEGDGDPGAESVVLISGELWQRAFGGRDDVVGSTLEIQGTPRTVVGVMPEGFDLDDNGIEVWRCLQLDPANPGGRASHYLYTVGRLGDGMSIDGARSEMAALVESWPERFPDTHTPRPGVHYLQMEPLVDQVVGEVRPALMLLLGAVDFVLLIACANVGNLLLARAESRRKEIAIRTALGASRGRLARQFLTESVLLALIGGVTGLFVGAWGLRALLSTSPDSIPRLAEVGLDSSVLVFTLLISLVTGVLFGLAPMLHLSVRSIASSIREGGDRATAGSARQGLRRLLVVGEIALAVVLVIGAGLMLRSFSALQAVDPGFDPAGLLSFRLFLPASDYPDGNAQIGFHGELTRRLESIPGVVAVTGMSGLPPLRRLNANDTEFEGLERTEDSPPHNIDYYQGVALGYFEAMGIGVVEGRDFGPADIGPSAQLVAIINERAAQIFYPGESPIGRRLRPCCGDTFPWLTIVGVAGDVKQGGLDAATGTEFYFLNGQVAPTGFMSRTQNWVIRTEVPPTSIAGQARQAVWSIDSKLPLADLQTMEQVLSHSVARPRFLARLLGVFGGLALVLAAIGTYGVMSYTVAERMHEMGIRIALGARGDSVLRLVLGQGMKIALAGLVIGVAGAFALTRLMSSILFGVGATDPVIFVAVPLILVLVAAAACLIPARRATRVDPIVVLREG